MTAGAQGAHGGAQQALPLSLQPHCEEEVLLSYLWTSPALSPADLAPTSDGFSYRSSQHSCVAVGRPCRHLDLGVSRGWIELFNAVVTQQHHRRQKPTASELVGTVGFVRPAG